MLTVIGSSTLAEGIVDHLGRRAVTHVPLPHGASAESRLTALRLKKGRPLVAATGEDERSILTAALAGQMGAAPVAAIVESRTLAARRDLAAALKIDRFI